MIALSSAPGSRSSILMKERNPIVKTPFITQSFRLGEDAQYGLTTGYVTEAKALPKRVQQQAHTCMMLDDLLILLQRYKLLNVELIELEGGFGATAGKPYLDFVQMMADGGKQPVRVTNLGLQPACVDRLRGVVDGFHIEIKVVPKGHYTDEDREFYGKIFNLKKPLIDYTMMLQKIVEMVDGMQFTYYSVPLFYQYSAEDIQYLSHFMENLRSPVMAGDKLLKGVING